MSTTMQVKFSEDENFGVDFENVGRDGKDGGYYLPAVDREGVISFQPSKDTMPAVPTANIRGPQGERGDPFTYEDFTPEQLEQLEGEPGYTPVRGTDYWTEDDQQAIVSAVLSKLPVYDGEVESV